MKQLSLLLFSSAMFFGMPSCQANEGQGPMEIEVYSPTLFRRIVRGVPRRPSMDVEEQAGDIVAQETSTATQTPDIGGIDAQALIQYRHVVQDVTRPLGLMIIARRNW